MPIANELSAFEKFATFLATLSKSCEIALEPTGDYHRPIAHFLTRRGHHVQFVSSIACHRTREALYNSWDKNDPKDAQVILHLLKGGVTQRFADPLKEGNHDLQELFGTYRRIVDRKVRVYHTLMTHYLPLYFPEAEPFIASSRSEWFLDVFLLAPIPADVLSWTKAAFLKKTVKGDEGHPTIRRKLVAEYYETAKSSVGIPVEPGSVAMEMFRLVLEEYIHLAKLRRRPGQDSRTPGASPRLQTTSVSAGNRTDRRAYDISRSRRPASFQSLSEVSKILRLRSLNVSIRAASRRTATLKARQCTAALRILDGRARCSRSPPQRFPQKI